MPIHFLCVLLDGISRKELGFSAELEVGCSTDILQDYRMIGEIEL